MSPLRIEPGSTLPATGKWLRRRCRSVSGTDCGRYSFSWLRNDASSAAATLRRWLRKSLLADDWRKRRVSPVRRRRTRSSRSAPTSTSTTSRSSRRRSSVNRRCRRRRTPTPCRRTGASAKGRGSRRASPTWRARPANSPSCWSISRHVTRSGGVRPASSPGGCTRCSARRSSSACEGADQGLGKRCRWHVRAVAFLTDPRHRQAGAAGVLVAD